MESAEKLAGTLEWLADRGVIEGLHPKSVRDAAKTLRNQAKQIQDMDKALNAKRHYVDLVTTKPTPYSKIMKFTAAVAEPRLFYVEHEIDIFRFEDEEYIKNHLPQVTARAFARKIEDSFGELCADAIRRETEQERENIGETPPKMAENRDG